MEHSVSMALGVLYTRGLFRRYLEFVGMSVPHLTMCLVLTFSVRMGTQLCSDDNEERALVVGMMNEMAYVFQAWLPLVVRQQVESARYPKRVVIGGGISRIVVQHTY